MTSWSTAWRYAAGRRSGGTFPAWSAGSTIEDTVLIGIAWPFTRAATSGSGWGSGRFASASGRGAAEADGDADGDADAAGAGDGLRAQPAPKTRMATVPQCRRMVGQAR